MYESPDHIVQYGKCSSFCINTLVSLYYTIYSTIRGAYVIKYNRILHMCLYYIIAVNIVLFPANSAVEGPYAELDDYERVEG